MKSFNVFCFPFAGGNKYCYNPFRDLAGIGLNIITLELPGRGERYNEPLLTGIDDMVSDLLLQMEGRLEESYAIYGHSMGSLLGYLVTEAIGKKNLRKPEHLFLTGACSPTLRKGRTAYYLLPKGEFIEQIKLLGGIEEEVSAHKDLIDMYEPILRADFQAVETYQPAESATIDTDITVIIGDEDSVTTEEAEAWAAETTGAVTTWVFSGNHFFIFNHVRQIIQLIKQNSGIQKPTFY